MIRFVHAILPFAMSVENMCVYLSECVCVFVCVRERERERVCVCLCESESAENLAFTLFPLLS